MVKYIPKEEVVVSGISGRYPESDSVEEFMDNLYANRDLVTDEDKRWPKDFLGLPNGTGKIKDLTKFDAEFFGINESEAHLMDPQIRIMLEITYEALWDAGIDPRFLCGTNTGTYIGQCWDETSDAQAEDYTKTVGYKQQFATKLAQVFNFLGPSIVVDTACASSFNALNEALYSIRNNLCERAIVVGLNLTLSAIKQLEFLKMNMLAPDGKSKCLDSEADGYAKGEACVAVVLQKRSEAKRIYVTLVHSKSNADGFKEMGITFPSTSLQSKLMGDTYIEANINPNDIEYVEAHCTGTFAGDPVEMASIVDIMCTDRSKPLLIGAVKSNIGHTEGASGLCSLTKVIFSFENQCIPANINMKTANPRIEGITSGILKPIEVNTPFHAKVAALNCFGFGGANVHIIVRSESKDPNDENSNIFGDIPRLILVCGPTENSVNLTLEKIHKNPNILTRDFLSLLNDVSKTRPFKNSNTLFKGMAFRGFTIINNETNSEDISKSIIRKVDKPDRKLWFIFSGPYGQWPQISTQMMSIKVFANSIEKSAQVLKEYDYKLTEIMFSEDEKTIKCPFNLIIILTVIQIALVDFLRQLDVIPDGFIGQSIGELGCAYADGIFTQEEIMRIAYCIGKTIKQENCKGKMVKIDLSINEIREKLPSDTHIACYHSEDSIVVAGNEHKIKTLVKKLNSENISNQIIQSTGIAFNCPLMSSIKENLLTDLIEIIPNKRLRSWKWLTTVYEGNDIKNLYSNAEYLTDCLINPVLLKQTLKEIPKNAIVIELLSNKHVQSIMESFRGDLVYITLISKNKEENNLLESLGELYNTGFNLNIENIYPKVKYPVSRGTPTLSSLLKWNHQKSYTVYQYPEYFNPSKHIDCNFDIDLKDTEYSYLVDHCIDGRILFPGMGYLIMAWKQLATKLGKNFQDFAVEFQNVQIDRATILQKDQVTSFNVKVDETTGMFSISNSNSITCSGKVIVSEKNSMKYEYVLDEMSDLNSSNDLSNVILENKDIYKEFRIRGYDYGSTFKCLTKAKVTNRVVFGSLKWNQKLIGFLDSFVQISLWGHQYRKLYLPVSIDYFKCNYQMMESCIKPNGESSLIYDMNLGIIAMKGVEILGIKFNLAPRNIFNKKPNIEYNQFVPFDETTSILGEDSYNLNSYLKYCNLMANQLMEKFIFENNNIGLEQAHFSDQNISGPLIDQDNKKSYLLRTLLKLNKIENKSMNEKIINELNASLLHLNKDHLNQYYKREYFLKQQFGIVIENMDQRSKKIKILEINQNSDIIGNTAKKMVDLCVIGWNVEYKLLYNSNEKLSEDMIENIEYKEWKPFDSKIPPELNNFDLLLFEEKFEIISSINLEIFFQSIFDSLNKNGFLFVIMKYKFSFAEKVLYNISNKYNDIKENNFKISEQNISERENSMIIQAKRVGLLLIATKLDGFSKKVFIFRKISESFNIEKQIFISITNENYKIWINELQNSLKYIDKTPDNQNIWLLADDNSTNGILGLVSCLRKEPKGDRIRCIFNYDSQNSGYLLKNRDVLESIVKRNLVINVMKSANIFGNFRRFTIDMNQHLVESEHCYINIQTKGDLSSFKWFEAQHKYWPLGQKTGEQLITVFYAPLNFRDVMVSIGKLPADALPNNVRTEDCLLGIEFAGLDNNGKRVIGMTTCKGMATSIVINEHDFVWSIPDQWSMEEASTIPVAYGTAYYALIIRGGLRPGEKVLIHSGSGAVGQAAISICISMNCQLFITCGSDTKREFLKKEFCGKLNDKNFCSSRNSKFKSYILQKTNGQGVDVVLNSLSGQNLQASVEVLAKFGRFLEIGKFDLSQNNQLDITKFIQNKTFHGIVLDSIFNSGQQYCSNYIKKQRNNLRQLIENGITNGTVKPLKRTVFNCTQVEQAFRFMASGKHIGKVILKIRDELALHKPIKYHAIYRTVFKPNKCYIIIGGLGGFGLEFVDWIIERGAVNILITSRNGLQDPYQKYQLKRFREMGKNIGLTYKNITLLNETRDLIRISKNFGTSKGVGGIFNFAMVLADGLFENQTPEQFEKVLAPKSLGVYNLDEVSRNLCPELEYFVCFSSFVSSRGHSGQSNYGFANSIMERICEKRRADNLPGMAIEWGAIGDVGFVAENMGSDVIIDGTIQQRIPSCLKVLDSCLQMNYSVVRSYIPIDNNPIISETNENLMKKLAKILDLKSHKSLRNTTTLVELGIDSLMLVEVKQILQRDFNIILSNQEISRLTMAQIEAIDSGKYQQKESSVARFNSWKYVIPVEKTTYFNKSLYGIPLFVLPPIEGSFDLLLELFSKLNHQVIGLNWTVECAHLKTIEEMAIYYINIIETILENCEIKIYNILGYSFGGQIAYQIAYKLQQTSDKIKLNLILLDSSPVLNRKIIDKNLEKFEDLNDNQKEIQGLILAINQFIVVENEIIKQQLENISSDQRIQVLLKILRDTHKVGKNEKNIEFYLKSFCKKLIMLSNYNVQEYSDFNGDCLLIRATKTGIALKEKIDEDYGLSKIINGKIDTIIMEGNHQSFIENNIPEITKIINEYVVNIC